MMKRMVEGSGRGQWCLEARHFISIESRRAHKFRNDLAANLTALLE